MHFGREPEGQVADAIELVRPAAAVSDPHRVPGAGLIEDRGTAAFVFIDDEGFSPTETTPVRVRGCGIGTVRGRRAG
jgi:hypothetical protein